METEKAPVQKARGPTRTTLATALTGLLQPDPSCEEPRRISPADEELDSARSQTEFPARWSSEARFFDELAEKIAANLQPLDPLTVARYSKPEHPWFNKEFRFQLLGDLRGKHVLDVGCGEGSNSMLMAKSGARVTGVDISPGSIDLCKQRARLEGVESQTQFLCSPLEAVSLPEETFDIIWGDGILHHLIPELDPVLHQLMRWARPGALFLFSEPVSLTPWLRKLRKGVPIHTDATPDERPLERAELAIILRHLPHLEMRWFHLLGRLSEFILRHQDYERSPLPRQLAVDLLGRLDRALLSVPRLQALGGMCVMHGWKEEAR
ncbi:class I SAM-dependent methyltransferase [Hyalangium sp.]|uniref:class I SAM-dependent methyltransferase n=1 Tax=Hyalangium sp. TaxID=2028555 RepID=UPI002D50E9B4|nr:class I SAM-dependent methyltransferase [Hyalangium sp.]HYI02467.1 class I SAM-dependent methyltransferase [Hyalangium sp.]